MRIRDIKSLVHRVGSAPRSTTGALGAILLTLGLLLAPLHFIAPSAGAQGGPIVSIQDIAVSDVNGNFIVTVNLDPGGSPITGLALTISYDTSLIQPVLNTSPFDGIVGAPRCTRLNGAGGACGPVNPSNTVNISLFRTSGAWQSAVDLVEVEFVAQGVTGVSELSIGVTEVLDINNFTITAGTNDGTVTIGSEPATATATPMPGNADLSIFKTAAVSGPLLPGSTVNYTITGTNAGPNAASDVVITDTLPAGLSFVASPVVTGWNCGTTDRTFTCSRNALTVGQDFVFSYDVEVDQSVVRGATLANQVIISTTSTDPDMGNNSDGAPVTIEPDSATPTPDPTGPTTTPTPTPDPTGPTTTPTPTPDPTGPTTTPTPTATSTPAAAATVTPTPVGTRQPAVPVVPAPEPALAYPGPFNNAPPSGAIGDGWIPTPNAQNLAGQTEAAAQSTASSTGTSSAQDASGESSVLAITGSQTSVLATVSLSLISVGGLLLVVSRREDTDD